MKKPRFKPAVEVMEARLTLSTITVVNDSTKTINVQYVRHIPPSSGMLSDGTSLGPPEPGYTEWAGSIKVLPGTVQNFSPGDSRPDFRISTGGSQYYTFPGLPLDGKRYIDLNAGYDLTRPDGSTNLNVTINKRPLGSKTPSQLGSLGVTTMTDFNIV
jgi:hypothetical protein